MEKFNTIKLFLFENKKKIILIISILFIFVLLVFSVYQKTVKQKVEPKLVLESVSPKIEEEEEKEKEEVYYIDIKGYVNNPGVYSLEKGKRVVDAINHAGGLKKEADTSLLNLSRVLNDQMVIIVYSKNEIQNYQQTKEKETQKSEICQQVIKNDACIINEASAASEKSKENTIKEETKEEIVLGTEKDNTMEKININKATKEMLMTLSKIGESKAKAIIEYREKNGNFQAIEEIQNVSGIGKSVFEEIKEFITV